ncbi:protein LURP-one-related 5-like [Zingiber officinale]|uniref:protein LURP-one-related 5-like n=1 Tax=Zingiber officinale TaxID=94328 RepID=UPI001C4C9027|nr:protein LURP-one-related 5-like [Zingiber officinale]
MIPDHPSVWTVWNKSSMGFQGTDGFSIYDRSGRLAFRVDNYSRRRKYLEGELLLMDGNGKPVITLRPQILSMHNTWRGFKNEDGTEETQAFSMRRQSILHGSEKAEVFMDNSTNHAPVPSFRTEGCFRARNCKILDSKGEEVALVSHKQVNNLVTLGDEVFSLVIQPCICAELVMAFLVILDRICWKKLFRAIPELYTKSCILNLIYLIK